jgi:hypothetical protein
MLPGSASKLGTRPESFSWFDGLTLLLIFAALLLLAGVEFLIGQAVRRIAARAWRSIRTELDRVIPKSRNDS